MAGGCSYYIFIFHIQILNVDDVYIYIKLYIFNVTVDACDNVLEGTELGEL